MLIFVHLFESTSVAIVELANSRWSVFVSIKLSQIGSFHLLWSWLLNVSSVLTSLKYPATFFGVLMRCGRVDGSWEY